MTPKQTDLFNQPRAPHNRTETSEAAAKSFTKKELNGMCFEVLRTVMLSDDGLTCEQVEKRLSMKHQTVSARLRDLITAQPPYLQFRADPFTGKEKRRANESGRTAKIYYAASLMPS